MLYEPEGHDHLAADYLDASGLLPLTAYFQHELYLSQHPPDCSSARFLVVTPGPNGIGSDLHVGGHHLLTAYTHGYVFLWGNSSGAQYVLGDPDGLCMDGALNYECFLRTPSNCTLDDAIDWEALSSHSATSTPSASPIFEELAHRRHFMDMMHMMHHRRGWLADLEVQLHPNSHHAFGVLSTLGIYNDNLAKTLPDALLARLRALGMDDWEVGFA